MAVSYVENSGEVLINLRNDTAVESDVAQGKTFHKADGTLAVGTASGGGSSELFETLVDRSIEEVLTTDLANLTEIGEYAFAYCDQLTDIEIPSNITKIGHNAFDNSALVTARVNEGCSNIIRAFENCLSLTTVYLPSTIGGFVNNVQYAFRNCEQLTDIYFNGTKSSWNTLYNRDIITGLTQPITVHCTDGDVNYNGPVGNMVLTFQDTTTLSIEVNDNITKSLAEYSTEEGFSVNDVVEVELPEGVLSLPTSFADGVPLTNVVLPSTLKTIGVSAFASCNLTSVTFPQGLTTIGDGAFSGTSLLTIDLPSSITEIGGDAFAYLQTQTDIEVTCRAFTPPTLGYNAFEGWDYATLTAIYVLSWSVNSYQQDTNWSQYAGIIQAIQ